MISWGRRERDERSFRSQTTDAASVVTAAGGPPGSVGAANQATDRRFTGIRFVHVNQPPVTGIGRFDDPVFLRDIEEHRADQIACAVVDPPVGIRPLRWHAQDVPVEPAFASLLHELEQIAHLAAQIPA